MDETTNIDLKATAVRRKLCRDIEAGEVRFYWWTTKHWAGNHADGDHVVTADVRLLEQHDIVTVPPLADPLDTYSLVRMTDAGRLWAGLGSATRGSPAMAARSAGTLSEGPMQSLIRWDHLLVPYYRTGVARPVTEPTGTQTTIQSEGLLGPAVEVDDCTFRMLEPHEIQAAMAFGAEYVVLGNKRERVRQLGNAVTPPAARDLIAAVVEAILGEAVAA